VYSHQSRMIAHMWGGWKNGALGQSIDALLAKFIWIYGTIAQFMQKQWIVLIIFLAMQVEGAVSAMDEEMDVGGSSREVLTTAGGELTDILDWLHDRTSDFPGWLATPTSKDGGRILDMVPCENPFSKLMERQAAQNEKNLWLLSADIGIKDENVFFWQYIDAQNFSIIRVMLGFSTEGMCVACGSDESFWQSAKNKKNKLEFFKTISCENALSPRYVMDVKRSVKNSGVLQICSQGYQAGHWQHEYGGGQGEKGFFCRVGDKPHSGVRDSVRSDAFHVKIDHLCLQTTLGVATNDRFQICESHALGPKKYAHLLVTPYGIELCMPMPLSIQCDSLPPHGGVPYVDGGVTHIPVFQLSQSAQVISKDMLGHYLPIIADYALDGLGQEVTVGPDGRSFNQYYVAYYHPTSADKKHAISLILTATPSLSGVCYKRRRDDREYDGYSVVVWADKDGMSVLEVQDSLTVVSKVCIRDRHIGDAPHHLIVTLDDKIKMDCAIEECCHKRNMASVLSFMGGGLHHILWSTPMAFCDTEVNVEGGLNFTISHHMINLDTRICHFTVKDLEEICTLANARIMQPKRSLLRKTKEAMMVTASAAPQCAPDPHRQIVRPLKMMGKRARKGKYINDSDLMMPEKRLCLYTEQSLQVHICRMMGCGAEILSRHGVNAWLFSKIQDQGQRQEGWFYFGWFQYDDFSIHTTQLVCDDHANVLALITDKSFWVGKEYEVEKRGNRVKVIRSITGDGENILKIYRTRGKQVLHCWGRKGGRTLWHEFGDLEGQGTMDYKIRNDNHINHRPVQKRLIVGWVAPNICVQTYLGSDRNNGFQICKDMKKCASLIVQPYGVQLLVPMPRVPDEKSTSTQECSEGHCTQLEDEVIDVESFPQSTLVHILKMDPGYIGHIDFDRLEQFFPIIPGYHMHGISKKELLSTDGRSRHMCCEVDYAHQNEWNDKNYNLSLLLSPKEQSGIRYTSVREGAPLHELIVWVNEDGMTILDILEDVNVIKIYDRLQSQTSEAFSHNLVLEVNGEEKIHCSIVEHAYKRNICSQPSFTAHGVLHHILWCTNLSFCDTAVLLEGGLSFSLIYRIKQAEYFIGRFALEDLLKTTRIKKMKISSVKRHLANNDSRGACVP